MEEQEAADALRLIGDCRLRGQGVHQLQASGLKDGGKRAGLHLGDPDRGGSTKTGPRQGVTVDYSEAGRTRRVRLRKDKSGPLFAVSILRLRALFSTVLVGLGHPRMPLHSVRHTGPSRDAFDAYRSLGEIMTRGRWRSNPAVNSYSKTTGYIGARARVSPALRKKGANVLESWGERDEVPRQ